jgi:hypothetical protein
MAEGIEPQAIPKFWSSAQEIIDSMGNTVLGSLHHMSSKYLEDLEDFKIFFIIFQKNSLNFLFWEISVFLKKYNLWQNHQGKMVIAQ